MDQPESDTDIDYFVCTLGQAAAINEETHHTFKTVNDFIDHQAREAPHRPAVGFPVTRKDADDEWDHAIYSECLSRLVQKAVAANLARRKNRG